MPATPLSLEDLVAVRELRVTGSEERVLVELGRPRSVNDDEARCSYRICYRGECHGFDVCAVDAFQALQLALKLVPVELRHRKSLPIGQLYWLEPGDDMGFPEQVVER